MNNDSSNSISSSLDRSQSTVGKLVSLDNGESIYRRSRISSKSQLPDMASSFISRLEAEDPSISESIRNTYKGISSYEPYSPSSSISARTAIKKMIEESRGVGSVDLGSIGLGSTGGSIGPPPGLPPSSGIDPFNEPPDRPRLPKGSIKLPKLMGSIGVLGLSYIALGIALRGPDYLSYTSSGISSFFGGLTTTNPYKDVILPGDHRVIPSLSNRTLMSTSRSDTYIDGYKVRDISIPSANDPSYKSIENNIFPELIAATGGIALGVGLDISMTHLSKNLAKKSNTFRHVFDKDLTGAFSKNFSPIVLGAIGGALLSDNSIEDKAQGTYFGAMVGGFVGFLSMKEEIGPMLNKRIGIGLIGGALGLMIGSHLSSPEAGTKVIPYSVSKEGSIRVTYEGLDKLIEQDKATLPYDFYKHPDANKLVESYLKSNREPITNVEDTANYTDRHPIFSINKEQGAYKTQIGKLNIGLDITIPSYSKEEGFIRVSQEEIQKRFSIDKDKESSADRANGLFNAYQMGLFIPSMALFTIGALAEIKDKPGVKKIVDTLTNYTDKVKYLWPGERAIGESIPEIASGAARYLQRGYRVGLNRGISKLGEGIKKKVIGEAFSLGKKSLIYAVPISIISSVFAGVERDNNDNVEIYGKEISHYEAIEALMPKATGNKQIDTLVNTQRYMEEGTAYKLGDVIIYDSGTIGKGLRNFLETAPDKSVKGLLYKLGHEQGLQEVIGRKAAIGGIGISGGDNIDTMSFWQEIGELFKGQGSWSEVLSYPIRAAKHESLPSGISTITSPIVGGIYNSLAINLGFDPIYNYKFDKDVYSPLAHSLNTLTYGAIGAGIGIGIQSFIGGNGNIPMRSRGRFTGALIGLTIGIFTGFTQPTYIDQGFYDSLSKQSQLSFGIFKESSSHYALTQARSSTRDYIQGALLTGGLPALGVGLIAPKRAKLSLALGAGLAGYTTGMAISSMTGNGVLPSTLPMSRRFLTNEYDLSKQTFSVLRGARRGTGRSDLSHIHSKTLWTREEVFISTGNLDTVWKNIYGDESQFNIAVRIRGEQAATLIPQLDILHSFMKGATSKSDLSSIVDQVPDLILGGTGSRSNEKILEFIQSAQGDLWISAPYLAGIAREVRPLVEAIKVLEAKGQNVHLIAQNPRGVSAGGQPQMSIALQRELLTAGVDIYTAPYTDRTLTHAKLLADDVKTFITSHNLFSGNSINKVVEIGIVLHGKEYADATKQAALRFMVRNNFSNIKDAPSFSPEVSKGIRGVERVKELYINPQFAGLFDHHSGYLLLDSQMGASFFYSRALYNNLQRQAGYYDRVITEEFGPATSLFKIAYLANLNENTSRPLRTDLSYIPFFVTQYDKELQTPGVGGLFNEFVSMRLGLGRLYKDEYGFVGSIAGTIGAILDRTYLFFQGGNIVGVHSNYDDIDTKDMKYKNRMFQEGTFEALFTYLAVTTESAVASIALYISLGEPLNLILGESFKTSTENVIRDAISEDKFFSYTKSAKRAYNLGLYNSTSSIQARLSLFSSIEQGDFFSVNNFKLTPYHISNLFLRERSYFLQREVLEPFILEKVNPYEQVERSQSGFRGVINKLIEEIRTPPTIRLIGSESTLENISKLVRLQNETTELLLNKGFNKNLAQSIVPEIIGYKEVRSNVAVLLGLDPDASLDLVIDTLKTYANNLGPGNNNLLEAVTTRSKLSNYTYTEEGKTISGINLEIGNVGIERATRVARAIQDLLDEIPLNPIHWRVFNNNSLASLLGAKEGGYQRITNRNNFTVISKVATMGDILSFTDLTQTMSEILFGKGGISAFIAANEVYTTDIDKSFARHSMDRVHTIWNITAGSTSRAISRAWQRYKLVMGTPFKPGLMKASESLKAMEFNLFNKIGDDGLKGITWGDDAALISKRIEELTKEANAIWEASIQSGDHQRISRYVANMDQRGFVAQYISEQLQPHVDPLARRINYIDDSVLAALQDVEEVHESLSSRGSKQAGTFLMEIQEHLRRETMEMFSTATMSGSNLQRRLIKLRPGDPYGLASKKKLASVAMSLLAIGGIFLEQLFTNTQGVSIFTQVATALTFSSYSNNNTSGVSTTFTSSTFLPGSGNARYLTNIGFNIGLLGLSHVIGASILQAQALDYTFDNEVLYRQVKELQGSSLNIRLKHIDASTGDEVVELVSDLVGDWSDEIGDTGIGFINKLAALGNEGYTFEYVVTRGSKTKYLSAFVEGKYLKTRAIRFVGNTWFNTAVTYAVLSMAVKGVKAGTASTLNFLRDTTGTLDPLLYGVIGAGLLASKEGFRGGAKGLVGGVLAGYILNSLGVKLLNIGGKGVKLDNLETGILAELSNFRHYVMTNLTDASRAELMAALWARNMESAYSILYKEPYGKTSNVIAKQITFPVFQFFFTSKVIGEQINAEGIITNPGQIYYSTGIQGPPISGLSFSFGLPFKIVKGKGAFGTGLAINDEDNMMDYIHSIAYTGVALGINTTALSIVNKFSNKLNSKSIKEVGTIEMLYKMSKGTAKLVDDVLMTPVEMGYRVVTSLATVDIRNAFQTAYKEQKALGNRVVGGLGSLALKTILGLYIGGQIGSLYQGVVSKNTVEYQDNVSTSTDLGAFIGGGLALSHHFIYPKIYPSVQAKLTKFNNIPRLPRAFGPLALGISIGALMANSSFGVANGMDDYETSRDSNKKYLLTAAGYGLVLGTIAYKVGNIGFTMGDTLQKYIDLDTKLERATVQATSGSKVNRTIGKIKKFYYSLFIENAQKEAQMVVETITNNQHELNVRYNQVKNIKGEGVANALPDGYARKALENIDSNIEVKVLIHTNSNKELIENINKAKGSFIEYRFHQRIFPHRVKRTVMGMIGLGLGISVLMQGNEGQFYDSIEGAAPGQDRTRASMGKMQALFRSSLADIIRLVTGRDKRLISPNSLTNIFRSASEYTGIDYKVQYEKLLKTRPDLINSINSSLNGFSQLMVFDNPNAFISVGVIGGAFRRSEYGNILTPYIQIQGTGADISTASYQMVSRFYFNSVIGGKNDIYFDIMNAVKLGNKALRAGQPMSKYLSRQIAIKLLSITAKQQPLQKRRKVSSINEETLDAISSDPMLGAILKHRVNITKNLSYQPPLSLATRLLLNNTETNPQIANPILLYMLAPDVLKELGLDIDKTVLELLSKDPFFLLSRSFIVNGINNFALNKDAVSNYLKGFFFPAQIALDHQDIWSGGDSSYISSYAQYDGDIGFAIMQASRSNPILQLMGNWTRGVPTSIKAMVGVAVFASLLGTLTFNIGRTGLGIEDRALFKEINDYFSSGWFKKSKDAKSFAWNHITSYPLIGQRANVKVSGENYSIIYKGAYQYLINNRIGNHRGIKAALDKLQGNLYELISESFGAEYDAHGVLTKRGTNLANWFLSSNKEKELIKAIESIDKPPKAETLTITQLDSNGNSTNKTFSIDPNVSIEQNLNNLKNFEEALEDLDDVEANKLIDFRTKQTGLYEKSLKRSTLISKITDVFAGDIDKLIDKYIDQLIETEVTVNEKYLSKLPQLDKGGKSISDIFDMYEKPDSRYKGLVKTVDNFGDANRFANISFITLLNPNMGMQDMLEISYLLKNKDTRPEGLTRLVSLMSKEQKALYTVTIDGKQTIDIHKALKEQARASITKAVEDYLAQFPGDAEAAKKALLKQFNNANPRLNNLALEVLGGLIGLKDNKDTSFFSLLRHHWLGLGTSPTSDVARVLSITIKRLTNFVAGKGSVPVPEEVGVASTTSVDPYMIGKSNNAPVPVGILTESGEEVINKVLVAQDIARAEQGYGSKMFKGFGIGLEMLGFGVDLIEAFSVMGGFSRLGKAYKSDTYTEAQIMNEAIYAGSTLVNATLSTLFLTVASHAVLSLFTVGVAGSILIPSLIVASMVLSAFAYQKWAPKGIKDPVDRFFKTLYENTGKGIKDAGDFIRDRFGKRAAAGVSNAFGGIVGGTLLAASLATISPISTFLGMGAAISMSGLFSFMGVGALLGGGVALAVGLTNPELMDKTFGYLVQAVSKVRIGNVPLGRLFVITPDQWMTEFMRLGDPITGIDKYGSPIKAITANDLIKQDYAQQLLAADDYSGSSAASLFIHSSMYGSYNTNSYIEKYGRVSIIRPSGVSSPMIQREIKYRGQLFNHSIVGRYVWNTLLANSSNQRHIRTVMERSASLKSFNNKVKQVSVQARQSVQSKYQPKSVTLLSKSFTIGNIPILASIIDKFNEARAKSQAMMAYAKLPLKAIFRLENIPSADREYKKDLKLAPMEIAAIVDKNIIRKVTTSESEIKEEVFNNINFS